MNSINRVTEPSPSCVNCARFKDSCANRGMKRSVAINGPMPCGGEHYARKSIYHSTVIKAIRRP